MQSFILNKSAVSLSIFNNGIMKNYGVKYSKLIVDEWRIAIRMFKIFYSGIIYYATLQIEQNPANWKRSLQLTPASRSSPTEFTLFWVIYEFFQGTASGLLLFCPISGHTSKIFENFENCQRENLSGCLQWKRPLSSCLTLTGIFFIPKM